MRGDASTSQSEFDEYVDRIAATAHQLPATEDDADRPLDSAMARAMRSFSSTELDASKAPHPHAFQAGDSGFFPIGEVTVVAAQGREGKTFALTAIAATYARGKRLSGFSSVSDRAAVIYSAEDDRSQYARKIAALRWAHGDLVDGFDWCSRIIVPDLEDADLLQWRELVKVYERRPFSSPSAEAIIATLSSDTMPIRAGLLIFETASTLSEADEDNAGLKALVATLKRIAKALQAAVVLVHHTSQAAGGNLPTLNIQVTDIRGATALVYNSRQCFFLVNLGSEADPHPETDARTMLRKLVYPCGTERISALVCLDSSKAPDPPPVFFQWLRTEYGPALREIEAPAAIRGMQWRKLLSILNGKRAEARAEAKDAKTLAEVKEAVRAVQRLLEQDKPATAKTVSEAAGHKQGWADARLSRAVIDGLLRTELMKLPRTRNETTVYFTTDKWMEESE